MKIHSITYSEGFAPPIPAFQRSPDGVMIARPTPTLRPSLPTQGVGTELKKLLAKIGIRSTPNCQCNSRAAEMDRRGPDWCEENMEVILGWLKQESDRRKLPFVAAAAKLLVRRAIKKARAIVPAPDSALNPAPTQ